jgi:hypothetical protein
MTCDMSVRRRVLRTLGPVLSACLLLALTAGSASADFGVARFDGSVLNQDGSAAKQAGGHPYEVSVDISLARAFDPNFFTDMPEGSVRNLTVDMPAGFVGNPQATPTRCTEQQLSDVVTSGASECPPSSQVGVVDVETTNGVAPYPVFNMEPPENVPGMFGFNVAGSPIHLFARVRSESDYGITVDVPDISQALVILGSRLTFWGVPADPRHDGDRGDCLLSSDLCPIDAPLVPFLSNPTRCTPAGTGLEVKLAANAWENPAPVRTSFFTHLPAPNEATQQGPADCERVPFDPSLAATPATPQAGAPSGYAFDLKIPQYESPAGIAAGNLQKAVVHLPDGVAVSPSAADRLEGCSDEQFGKGSLAAATCPEGSKIGTVSVETPLLGKPLTGSVYLGRPTADQLLRLFIVASGSGVTLKLPGSVTPDPVTGQLNTTFDNNPQMPFSRLLLEFKGGPRAALSNPPACGTYTTTAELTSYSGKVVNASSSFAITQGANGAPCPAIGFTPGFKAGTISPAAGADSAFSLTFSRDDDDQMLKSIAVDMPQGLLGRIAGVPLCAEAQASAGTCGEASRVGSVTTGAGPGTNPFSLPGRVYLGGPYKGAPFSLSIVVPAVAGPLDLGTVVVRSAITIDPLDAHVTVVSDPLPAILKGIPLQIRVVRVNIDRPGFMVNPTSCAPKAVAGVLHSVADATAAVASRFQVGDCASLALKPSLALSLSGKGQTTDGKHPAVTATLTQPVGQANLKKVRVALPLSLALDVDNASGLCEFADGSKVEPTCPKASIVGTATARTPILDEPLSGPVYFVKNVRKDPKSGREIRTLPKLVVPLVGQNGVKLTLTGTSDVVDDQLVTTFDNVPDAPVSGFTLNIIGGRGGILVVSGADICKATQIADQQINGQNNKSANADVSIQTPSCPLKVLSKKVGKTSVAIKVGGLGAGKLTVTGRGIKKTNKTISKSTVATVTAKRTKGAPGRVTASFDPTGPAKARKATK